MFNNNGKPLFDYLALIRRVRQHTGYDETIRELIEVEKIIEGQHKKAYLRKAIGAFLSIEGSTCLGDKEELLEVKSPARGSPGDLIFQECLKITDQLTNNNFMNEEEKADWVARKLAAWVDFQLEQVSKAYPMVDNIIERIKADAQT